VVIFLVLKKIDELIISSSVNCSFIKSSVVETDYSSCILCHDSPALMTGYLDVEKIIKKDTGYFPPDNPKGCPNSK